MTEPNNLARKIDVAVARGSPRRELSRKVDAGVPARVALGRPENRGRDAAVHPDNRFGSVEMT